MGVHNRIFAKNSEVVAHCKTRCVISRVFVICRRPKCGRQKWLNNCQFHVIRQRCLKLWFEIENSFLWLDLYTILKNRATSRIVYRIKLYSITLVKYVFHTHIFNTLKMTLIWPVATVWLYSIVVLWSYMSRIDRASHEKDRCRR